METILIEKKRSVTLDICRGIAIFLVVWGHIIQQGMQGMENILENTVIKVIYSFHMPLFVMISGYFFYFSSQKKNGRELLMKRSFQLLRLIFLWNSVHYFLMLISEHWVKNDRIFSLRTWWKAIMEGYWFLWAILFCTLAVGITVKYLPERFWMAGFLFFAPLAGISPCRWVILSVYPIFITGFWYGKLKKEEKKTSVRLKYAALPVFGITLAVYLHYPAIGNSEWRWLMKVCLEFLTGQTGGREVFLQAGRVLLYYVLGITGSVSVLVITDALLYRWRNLVLWGFFARLGQYSLQIYILQRVLLELLLSRGYQKMVEVIGYNPVEENMVLFTWGYSPLISMAGVILLYGIARYILRGNVSVILFTR